MWVLILQGLKSLSVGDIASTNMTIQYQKLSNKLNSIFLITTFMIVNLNSLAYNSKTNRLFCAIGVENDQYFCFYNLGLNLVESTNQGYIVLQLQ